MLSITQHRPSDSRAASEPVMSLTGMSAPCHDLSTVSFLC